MHYWLNFIMLMSSWIVISEDHDVRTTMKFDFCTADKVTLLLWQAANCDCNVCNWEFTARCIPTDLALSRRVVEFRQARFFLIYWWSSVIRLTQKLCSRKSVFNGSAVLHLPLLWIALSTDAGLVIVPLSLSRHMISLRRYRCTE